MVTVYTGSFQADVLTALYSFAVVENPHIGVLKMTEGWEILRVCVTVFYTQRAWATSAGATIFVLGAITDWLDGYLARKVVSFLLGAYVPFNHSVHWMSLPGL